MKPVKIEISKPERRMLISLLSYLHSKKTKDIFNENESLNLKIYILKSEMDAIDSFLKKIK